MSKDLSALIHAYKFKTVAHYLIVQHTDVFWSILHRSTN